jgi:small-conductance mechanosensitive channel
MSRPNFSKFTDDELLQVAKVKIAKSKDVNKANKMILNQFEKNLKAINIPNKFTDPIMRKVKQSVSMDKSATANLKKAKDVISKELKNVVKDLKAKPTKRPAGLAITNIKLKSPTKTKAGSGISETRRRFNAAFRKARNAGKATFTFDGKKFTTNLRTDKKKTSPSLPKMVTLKSGKKGTIAQRLKEIDSEKNRNKTLSLVRSSMRAKK